MRLDEDMQRVVREQRLAFVATVCPDGTPNLSPKGTTIVWDDEHLVFLHIHSPDTVANLMLNPSIAINVVDPIVRTGYRFKGTAEVLIEGVVHDEVVDFFVRVRGTDSDRIRAVVMMTVEAAAPVVSPAYDLGARQEDIVRQWRDHHVGLAARRLEESSTEGAAD